MHIFSMHNLVDSIVSQTISQHWCTISLATLFVHPSSPPACAGNHASPLLSSCSSSGIALVHKNCQIERYEKAPRSHVMGPLKPTRRPPSKYSARLRCGAGLYQCFTALHKICSRISPGNWSCEALPLPAMLIVDLSINMFRLSETEKGCSLY